MAQGEQMPVCFAATIPAIPKATFGLRKRRERHPGTDILHAKGQQYQQHNNGLLLIER